ncbi:MAG TPA: SAM-dependent methyltransferase [Gammaproteobacteria bacterium]|nr:SAM-dependent methyltransferase [Gammaproteobacteria bacterium]
MNTEKRAGRPPGPPLAAITLLSAAALAYEVLLMRLFSIIQWHHFAYMIISLALLGYGASGTFLALLQRRLLAHYPAALLTNLLLFAGSALPAFLLAQDIPFNPEQMLWEARELLHLAAIYLLLSLPFFFAANAIALTLARYRRHIGRVYAVDLLGAGAGSIGVVLLAGLLAPLPALGAIVTAALLSVALAARKLRLPRRGQLFIVLLLLAATQLWVARTAVLHPSPYKDISQALRVSGARLLDTRAGPLALLQVVANDRIPLRYAPGLSLNARQGPPPQLGLFADGNSLGAITRDEGHAGEPGFLDQLTSALPYHLATPEHTLIIGAGGGLEVLQARRLGSGRIDAVELDPGIVELVSERFAAFSGDLYHQPGVHARIAEGRGFVETREARYDLIQLTLQGTGGSGGLFALSENYLYTVEALESFLAHLDTDGWLAFTRWTRLPPRGTLKLFATAIEALRRRGVDDPGQRLLLIRGWQTSTLLIAARPVDDDLITAMKSFCRQRSFDLVWYPGMPRSEANRYNVLRAPYFHDGARALLGPGAEAFLTDYKFDLRPATDDRPYFNNFFKWSTLPEILELRERGGLPLLEAGYPVLIAALLQALAASALLILLPLLLLRSRPAEGAATAGLQARVVSYFAGIGLAFLFMEMAFIQKFMLFLHHPLYTTAVVLASFLVFAGAGSRTAQRLAATTGRRRATLLAVGGILLTTLAGLLWLDSLFAWLAHWPVAARVALSVALIAPLAWCMGMPFPLALGALGQGGVRLIPLAWGVNGCASVVSAVLATLLAIHFGFTVVIVLALLLYLGSAAVFPSPPSPATGAPHARRVDAC